MDMVLLSAYISGLDILLDCEEAVNSNTYSTRSTNKVGVFSKVKDLYQVALSVSFIVSS